jgi:hypothetical protein
MTRSLFSEYAKRKKLEVTAFDVAVGLYVSLVSHDGAWHMPLRKYWEDGCDAGRLLVKQAQAARAPLPNTPPVILVAADALRAREESVRNAHIERADKIRRGLLPRYEAPRADWPELIRRGVTPSAELPIPDLEAEAGMLVTDPREARGPVYTMRYTGTPETHLFGTAVRCDASTSPG